MYLKSSVVIHKQEFLVLLYEKVLIHEVYLINESIDRSEDLVIYNELVLLVELFVKKWGNDLKWKSCIEEGPHEANFLKLDCSKLKSKFSWHPRWNMEKAVKKVVDWSKCWISNGDIRKCMDMQIEEFMGSE